MRNKISASMLCLLSCSIIHAQNKTDRERAGLKGLVQTVKVLQMTVVTEGEKQTFSPLVLSHATSYDRAGKRTELVLYDKTGALSRRIAYTYQPGSNRPSELATYDANNVMVRKVIDTFGSDGIKSGRIIHDYNEDGSFYRKTVLTFDPLGELVEAADYREDGSLIKKDTAPFKESLHLTPTQIRPSENEDRIVGWGARPGEYFDPDAHGNWTRGIASSTSTIYSSGKRLTTKDVVQREFTYYQ